MSDLHFASPPVFRSRKYDYLIVLLALRDRSIFHFGELTQKFSITPYLVRPLRAEKGGSTPNRDQARRIPYQFNYNEVG